MLGAGRRQLRDEPIPRLLYPCSLSLQAHALAILFEFSSPTPELAHLRIHWSVESGLCGGVFISLEGSKAPQSQKKTSSLWVVFFLLSPASCILQFSSGQSWCTGFVSLMWWLCSPATTHEHTHCTHIHSYTFIHRWTYIHMCTQICTCTPVFLFFLFSCHPLSPTKCQEFRKGHQLPGPWL